MNSTLKDLQTWMDTAREGPNLEFKEAKNQYDTAKLYRYCVALANEGGGKLILGITDKHPRSVVGTQAFPNVGELAGKIFGKLHFRVDIEEIAHPSGRVMVFHIPSRPVGTAYQYEGAYLMRSGEDLVPMTEDRLRQIFTEGKPEWLARSARENCTDDDIVQLLATQSYYRLMRRPYPATRREVLERFSSERLIQESNGLWDITNLGAILFAEQLSDFDSVAFRTVHIVVYNGTNKLEIRQTTRWEKGYAVAFEDLISTLISVLPGNNEVLGQALRSSVRMFPDIAIRELVANALIHQDFNESGSSVTVEIYTDRMEIRNPGRPFISVERFIDEASSRNERLADLMRRLGICERLGSGVDKVINAVEISQLPAPDFRVHERSTTAILFAQKPFAKMGREDRIRACYQHCCLRYVMNEHMTNQSLRERFGLSEKKTVTVSQIIALTVEAGQILPVNVESTAKRYARYVPNWGLAPI